MKKGSPQRKQTRWGSVSARWRGSFKSSPSFVRHRIATIVVHHTGRNPNYMRGTTRREDDAFWIMRLKEPADEGAERGAHFVSRFTKNRNAPLELLPLDWTITPGSDGTLRVGTVETSTADLIVQWVRDGLSTPSDIAAETGLSKGTISRHATRLIKTGRLMSALPPLKNSVRILQIPPRVLHFPALS